jgi:hypothetical protein
MHANSGTSSAGAGFRVLEPVPVEKAAGGDDGGKRLAPRLDTLAGKTIAFVDGWGRRTGDGEHEYPLVASIRKRMQREHGIKQSLWYPKESIAKGLSSERMADLIKRSDAVVVGEAI